MQLKTSLRQDWGSNIRGDLLAGLVVARSVVTGFVNALAILMDEIEAVLPRYLKELSVDLLVMGAYGHSRIRHLIVGSTTTTLLRTSPVPVLILR